MRQEVEGRSLEGRDEHLAVGLQVGERLIEEIRPLVARHGVGTETLACALEESLLEVEESRKDREFSTEELRSILVGLVLWNIFGGGPTLWIRSKTEAGYEVRLDVQVLAFEMWRRAVNFAARCGVDSAAAAEALAAATHATTDRLAETGQETEDKIRDVRNYLFATYMHRIFDIAGKQGSGQTNYVDMAGWAANRKLSDKGTFMEGLERGIYCREFLDAMPQKAKSVAIARYVLGYDWPETAGALGSSVNAVQKALSAGVQQAIGTWVKQRRARRQKSISSEISKKRNKKASS